MPVKQNWIVNMQVIDDLAYFASDFNNMAHRLFDAAAEIIEPALLDELRVYPPVPPGSTYVRTYRLRDGWFVIVYERGVGEFVMQVGNDVTYTQFVVGSLAQANAAASRFQRDYHRQHGWQLATDTVQFWFEAFIEEYQQRFSAQLAQFGTTSVTRRASTRR